VTWRLLAGYVGLTLFVLVALEVPLGVQHQRSERSTLETKVEHDATTLAAVAEDALQSGRTADLRTAARYAYAYAQDSGARVVIVDRRGYARVDTSARIEGAEAFASRPEIRTALGGGVAIGTRHSETLGQTLLYVAVPVTSGGTVHGAARVTFPTSAVEARVRHYWLILGVIAAVVLAAAVAVGVSVARFVTSPLRRLEAAAAAVGAGELTARAPEQHGPPEVRSLARVFNDTVAKLDLLLASQREFVADASHELRTPLTALRLRLENGDVEGALSEVERLADLVDALLALARADATAETAEIVDLAALARERVEHWGPLAQERGIELVADVSPSRGRAGRGRLTQVLDNLLANALDAARTEVRVSTREATLRVVDDGPGLAPSERARAFDRFWSGREGGSGLGLAIVKRLVETDGGAVDLGAAESGGLEATVRLRAA